MVALATASIYSLIYLPTLGTSSLGLSKASAQMCSVLGGAILLVATPVFGWLSDRRGHVTIAMASACAMIVLCVPVFALLDLSRGFGGLALAQACLSVLAAAYLAALSPCLADLFPTRTRTFSISMAYNIAALVIGGFAPLGLAMLTATSPHHFILGFYPAGAALIAALCLAAHARLARS